MIRKSVSVILVLMLLAPAVYSTEIRLDTHATTESVKSSGESLSEGRMAADNEHSSAGWIAGGLVSGGLFSVLGTGVITLIAAGSNPSPAYIPDDVETGAYLTGYRQEARRKNTWAAGISGSIMSAVWIMVVLSSMN
jgi:hypothetical protein